MATTMALALAACGGNSGPGGESGDSFITIGIKFDQPGLGLADGTNYTGFDVEVARYIAGELGFDGARVRFKEAPSVQRETLIETGQVKLVVATYSITEERRQKVSFAGPYFIAGQALLVRTDDTTITGPDTLNGKKLCSVTGSTSADTVKDNYSSGVTLRQYDTYTRCVEALSKGSIDAVTTDNVILAGFASEPQYQGKTKVVGDPFSEERYGVGLKKGDVATCVKVSTALEKMVVDGSWQRALDSTVGVSGFTADATKNPPKPDACS